MLMNLLTLHGTGFSVVEKLHNATLHVITSWHYSMCTSLCVITMHLAKPSLLLRPSCRQVFDCLQFAYSKQSRTGTVRKYGNEATAWHPSHEVGNFFFETL